MKKKYSPLIRKLVQVSAEARCLNQDVSERLKVRCAQESDLIRQTLMSAVCDPRFKMHVCAVPSWRMMAEEMLERFAEKLIKINRLTEKLAISESDEMLSEWFGKMIAEAEKRDSKLNINSWVSKEELQKYVDDFLEGKTEDEEQTLPLGILEGGNTSSEEKDNYNYYYYGIFNDDNELSDDGGNAEVEIQWGGGNEEDGDEFERMGSQTDGQEMCGMSRGKGNNRAVEDRFLKKVPASLIELAKRIGRSAKEQGETSGSFLTASKSDIVGITTGNDLSNLMPSELALMADQTTENLFYKNYVTRNLQLFASHSQSSRSKRHKNGPIIICLDASGSMEGEPIIVAKALTLAICIIAQRKKRKIIVIKYSDNYQHFFVQNISAQKKLLLEFISEVKMGGNDEDRMFKWLFEKFLPEQGDYQYGDVLCISDFGWTPVSPQAMELIDAEKKKNMVFYGLNIDKNGSSQRFLKEGIIRSEQRWGRPENVLDSLWVYGNGVCLEVK